MEALRQALKVCPERTGGKRTARTMPPPPLVERAPEVEGQEADRERESGERVSEIATRNDMQASAMEPPRRAISRVWLVVVALLIGIVAWALRPGSSDVAETPATEASIEEFVTEPTESEIEPSAAAVEPTSTPVTETDPSGAPEPEPEVVAERPATSEPRLADSSPRRRARMGRIAGMAPPMEPTTEPREDSPMRRALTDNRDPWAE
jgi:hypothetical protein